MAVENVSFYKYLEAAFRYRLFNPQGVRATLKTRFNYPGFNLTYDRIFYYARRVLPSFYRTSFPDTEEGNLQMARTVLEKLDQHQDLELDRYFTTPPAENAPVIEEAAEESVPQQPPAAAPAAAGPLPGVAMRPPSMPRLPSVTQKTSEPTRKFNLSVFKPPASFANIAKNFGSKLGVFFKKNVGKFFTVGRIATVVSSGIGAVVGAGLTNSSPAGIFGGAGLGAITPSWIRSGGGAKFLGQIGNGAINFGANLSNQVASGATRLSMSSGSKKWALGLLGAFILFFGISLIGGLTGTTSPGQAGPLPSPIGGGCPDTSGNRNPATCRYLNPSINLFDTNISQSAIDAYVNKYSSIFINAGKGDINEFKRRVDYIVSNAKTAGLNPAMFLGYWKTESMFSTMGDRDMGCQGSDFYNQVDCALGINAFTNPNTNPIANCAKSKDAGSVACQALKSIRARSYDLTHPINYPIKTFDDFAEAYGPYDDLVGGQPTNCTHTYNELIDMAKELEACQAVPPGGGSDFASQLVDKIKKSFACIYNGNNSIVHSSNAGACMNSVNPPQLTAQEIISSALSYIYLQCVGFVQAVVGGITGQFLDRVASAYMYKDFPPSGYKFTTRTNNSAIIKVGDLAIWDRDADIRPDGHVAYVVKVYDSSTFDVAEANWSGHGIVGLRTVDINEPGFAGWAQKL